MKARDELTGLAAHLRPLAVFAISLLAVLSFARIGLVGWNERVTQAGMLENTFLPRAALRLVLLGALLMLPVLCIPLLTERCVEVLVHRIEARAVGLLAQAKLVE